jgi:hypothetical protein
VVQAVVLLMEHQIQDLQVVLVIHLQLVPHKEILVVVWKVEEFI